MRIFVAGATGVVGVHLVPKLLAAGHRVAGMTRSPHKAALVRMLGAEPVVCNVFDREEVIDAVSAFRTECVVHQLTDLPDNYSCVGTFAARNARIRREGTRNLLDAALAANVGRFFAQSVAWEFSPGDGAAAVRELESTVLTAGGVVLRYGRFYGPGTYYQQELPPPPRIHVDAAAVRTVSALNEPCGVITVADNEGG